MRGPNDVRAWGASLGPWLAVGLLIAAGCSTTAPTARAPGAAPEARARAAEPRPSRRDAAARESAVDQSTAAEENPIEAVAIDRPDSENPAIETTETGFTITEQIRIPGEVRTDYARAVELLGRSDFVNGVPLLVAVTERAPELTAPHIDLGIAYGRAGDLERAEVELTTAARLSPNNPVVNNELGIVYRRTGRFADARASYERAIEVFPGYHFARRNLAILCDLYLRDLPCALEHYEAYLDNVIEDREVEIWVADVRNRLGQ